MTPGEGQWPEPGDLVRLRLMPENGIGVVCRWVDGGVQVFFDEGPDIDDYTAGVYPAVWLEVAR